jgi:hypothetical protein
VEDWLLSSTLKQTENRDVSQVRLVQPVIGPLETMGPSPPFQRLLEGVSRRHQTSTVDIIRIPSCKGVKGSRLTYIVRDGPACIDVSGNVSLVKKRVLCPFPCLSFFRCAITFLSSAVRIHLLWHFPVLNSVPSEDMIASFIRRRSHFRN